MFNIFQQIDLYAQLIKSIPFFFRSSKSRDPFDLLAQKHSVRMTGINTEISTAVTANKATEKKGTMLFRLAR